MDWSRFEKGVFHVTLLGIVYNPKSRLILIGERQNDPHIKKLSWTFPGGAPGYGNVDLEAHLKRSIKARTGLKVAVKKLVFAKTYPERREFLAVYYLCKLAGGRERAAKPFVRLKWVKPTAVRRYFTTSLHSKVFKFLQELERAGA